MTVQSVPETLVCETGEVRPKRGLVAEDHKGVLEWFLEHGRGPLPLQDVGRWKYLPRGKPGEVLKPKARSKNPSHGEAASDSAARESLE